VTRVGLSIDQRRTKDCSRILLVITHFLMATCMLSEKRARLMRAYYQIKTKRLVPRKMSRDWHPTCSSRVTCFSCCVQIATAPVSLVAWSIAASNMHRYHLKTNIRQISQCLKSVSTHVPNFRSRRSRTELCVASRTAKHKNQSNHSGAKAYAGAEQLNNVHSAI
jgi:hypothetical protein